MNKSNYPTNKILYTYAILGGLVGGLLIGLFALVGELDGIKDILDFIGSVLFISIIGMFVGFIPATATGYLIGRFKFYKKPSHFIIISLIGFFTSFIFALVFLFFTDKLSLESVNDDLTIMSVMGLLGALSAIIIGWFVLPKSIIGNKESV